MMCGNVNIQSLNELENGIHSFDYQVAEANKEIEHKIDLYFLDFERGLHILEERLRKAEDNLERAWRSLERQRSKRIWVEDKDGDGGHYEHADCSAEEAMVARCQAITNRCRHDVDECRQMISDARTKRYIHGGKYSLFKNKVSEAVERMQPIKKIVERFISKEVPSSFSSGVTSAYHSSAVSVAREENLSRPRPPMSSGTYGPKATTIPKRPQSPQNERMNPSPQRTVTEADRPRSPLSDGECFIRNSASSLWEDLDKIIDKHKNDTLNE